MKAAAAKPRTPMMMPTAIPALAPVERPDGGDGTVLFESAAVSVLLLLLLLLPTLVPVADAVAAVPVPVGVLDGVIVVDDRPFADEVGDAAAVVDEEESESSLILKDELWNGSPKL